MRILVTGVAEHRDGAPGVAFSCAIGSAVARWQGKTQEPHVGAEYDVELDIDDVLRPGDTLQLIESSQAAIKHSEEVNEIIGLVEAVDDDGMLFVRLSPDCLMMVEITHQERLGPGQWLRMRVPRQALSVWPFGS